MNIIITGASSGIGFEAAIELALNPNHKILALARNEQKLTKLLEIAKGLEPNCQLFPVVFDIVEDNHQQLAQFVESHLDGKIDILINNAGALINKKFAQLEANDMVQMLQSNVLGHFQMIQMALPYLQPNSHVVNIGSMGGVQGSVKFEGLSAYSASKAALHVLTECLAMEYAAQGIKFNCLALGSAQTEMLEAAFPNYESPVMAFEMGKYVADFAKTGHKFFNGKIIPVAVTTP